jgi:hypothetical protein
MNQRIRELIKQHGVNITIDGLGYGEGNVEGLAELIVRECAGLIHLECKDFANGNCFHDDALWESVTTEYGKNKERGFDPVGMSIHFDKMLKKHFGVEE